MKKFWGWLGVIVIVAALYLWQPELFHNTYYHIARGDIPGLSEYLSSFGVGTIIIIMFLFIVMTFTIVFPFAILEGAVSLVYGMFFSVLLSWLGEFIGAIVMFVFARYFFKQSVEKWIAKSKYLQQVDDYSAKNGFKALLIARLLPLAPSGIITAVTAVSKISSRDFLLATFIGKLPPVVIKVLLGHDVVYAGQNTGRLLAVTLLVLAVYGCLWWHKRNKQQN